MNRSEATLRNAWRKLGGAESDRVIDAVIARYSEVERRYHTVDHVAAVLDHVDRLLSDDRAVDGGQIDADVVRAGALFHDVVYDPRSSSNEQDSARLAVEAVRSLGWDATRQTQLDAIILATATHAAESAESAVLLDADLAILGAPPLTYWRYVDAVRAEYSFVDDSGWTEGRSAVVRSLLERPHIFTTAAMRASHEPQARLNLVEELRILRSSIHQSDDFGP